MGFDHLKEDLIGQLQRMKRDIDQTIILIDKADNQRELVKAIIDSPVTHNITKGDDDRGRR